MFRSICISLLVIAGLNCPVQADDWVWQHPLPQGNHLQDVCFADSSAGYAVGDGETILGTRDGGASWQLLHHGLTGITFAKIQMADSQNGWLLARQYYPSEYSWIYKTTDGWDSWAAVMETPHPIFDMHWIDDQTGWAGSDVGLHRTLDGGLSWITVLIGHKFEQVFFFDQNNGWAGHEGTVYRTSSGGTGWQPVEVYRYAEGLVDIQFTTPADGWLITYWTSFNYEEGRVFASSDSGATWTEQLYVGGDFGPYVHFLDIEMQDTLNGYVCVDDGELYRTTNGGQNWMPVDTLVNPLGIEFIDTCAGWSVGYYGMISHQAACGQGWQRQDNGQYMRPDEFNDFQAFSAQSAIGNDGRGFFKTTDGGQIWQYTPFNLIQSYGAIFSFYYKDELHGWVSYSDNSISAMAVTEDGGGSFTPQPDVTSACREIFFLNSEIGWAVGNNKLYSTTNGGDNWQLQTFSVKSQYYSVCFIDSLKGWLGGSDVIHTTDGGQSWSSPALADSGQIRQLRFRDSQAGFALAYDFPGGFVFRTTDGGEHWQKVLDLSGDVMSGHVILNDLIILEDGYVYAAGTSRGYPYSNVSLFYKSSDNGDTWEAFVDIPLADGIYKIAAVDRWRMWVLGPGGAIACGPNGTGTGVAARAPAAVQLFQNYPNPFNPYTTIVYLLSRPGPVTLSIYNILGQRIRRFSFPGQNAGPHQVVWDGRTDEGRPAASGLYFYRLEAGGTAHAKKMLLLK